MVDHQRVARGQSFEMESFEIDSIAIESASIESVRIESVVAAEPACKGIASDFCWAEAVDPIR